MTATRLFMFYLTKPDVCPKTVKKQLLVSKFHQALFISIKSYLPGSKLGHAIGDNSTLINNMPSAGLTDLGSTTWHETWAIILQKDIVIIIVVIMLGEQLFWFLANYLFLITIFRQR